MACLDMYSSSSSASASASASANQNSDHKGLSCAPMSPRISFSNDFAESNHSHHQQMIKPREASPASSDFEFSVTNYSMMSADELFFKGRLLPFKDSCTSGQLQKPTTLREELLVEDEDDDDHEFSVRPPKGSTRWKGILGLKKTPHIGSNKKTTKPDGSVEKRPGFVYDLEAHASNSSQELLNDGGSSCRRMEFGM